MTRLNMGGAEIGISSATASPQPDNIQVVTGAVTRDTSIFRSGVASYKFNSSANAVATAGIAGFSTVANRSQFFRGYFYFTNFPDVDQQLVVWGSAGGSLPQIRLRTGGALALYSTNSVQQGSDSVALNTNQWYCVEMYTKLGSSGIQFTDLELKI